MKPFVPQRAFRPKRQKGVHSRRWQNRQAQEDRFANFFGGLDFMTNWQTWFSKKPT